MLSTYIHFLMNFYLTPVQWEYVQRGDGTCSMAHSSYMAELELKSGTSLNLKPLTA